MNEQNPIQKDKKTDKVFLNRKLYDRDFSNQDLSHADFRGCTLVNCNFDNSDLSYATFEGANCYRSSFRQSKLFHTSFKDAVLAETIMDPRDAFGMTISLSCDAMDKAKIGKNYAAAWLMMLGMMELTPEFKVKLDELVRDLIGEERAQKLQRYFDVRAI